MAEIASLIRVPSRQTESSGEDLLKLYWNRATVKRELSALRRERHQLLDNLKEQEGAIIRAREELESLERLLANPLAAANAMVYFQFRHLWRVCALRVQQFAKELRAQRERKERAKLHATVLDKRKRRLDILNEKLQGLLIKERNISHEAQTLQKRLDSINGFTRLMQGRGIKRRISGLEKGREALEMHVTEVKETQASIHAEPLPELTGLSLESRRLINLAVMALAQELVLHFSEHNLAALAKEASERPVSDMKFGDRRDCDRLVERIRSRLSDIKDQAQVADAVKLRTDYLLTQTTYRDDTAAVPLAETFAAIPPQFPSAAGGIPAKRAADAPLRINVLADDYWSVLDVLL